MSEEYQEPKESEDIKETETDKQEDDDYEKVCFICRRPENRAGRLIRMPGNMDVCSDCMQKAFNSLQSGNLLGNYQEILKNYPNMGMDLINLNELGMNSPEVPKRQKLKK